MSIFHYPFVLCPIRSFGRKSVSGSELFPNVFFTLFKFIHHVYLIQSRKTRVCDGMACKFMSLGCVRSDIIPCYASRLVYFIIGFVSDCKFSITYLFIKFVHSLISFFDSSGINMRTGICVIV